MLTAWHSHAGHVVDDDGLARPSARVGGSLTKLHRLLVRPEGGAMSVAGRRRTSRPKGPCGLEVDEQFEPSRKLHHQAQNCFQAGSFVPALCINAATTI